MTNDKDVSLLHVALGMMNAAIPEMFDDPVSALRALVPSLRYVVIAKTDSPTIEQLKVLQGQSYSFCNVQATNLIAIRKAIMKDEIRLEAVPQNLAEVTREHLTETGLQVSLVPLSEEVQSAKLQILNDPPPANKSA